MCGILGTVNVEFDNATLDLIKHRGPDDYGLEVIDLGINKVYFAQRRLSIIDLSPAGHQPMISNCGNYTLIFNGEIYNHLDLREKLDKSINYRGHSDTETILNYLIVFGPEAIKDLNGIFAIAFLDKQKKKLTIARDPFGVKPLYFSQSKNTLVFSSEIRPIKELISKQDFDKKALATLLKLRYNPSPKTLIDSIQKIKPGCLMTFDLENELESKTLNYGIKAVTRKLECDYEKALDLYEEHFEKAIKRQLLSDVEVGIMLSGGVDSALVAYYAKKHYKGNLKAFTIGFEGSYNEDEINDAKETAVILGLEHHVKKINFSDFLGLMEECTRIVEEPLATTSIIPMYYLSKLTSEHVKVALTGQGADEPLGGYGRYKSELLVKKVPKILKPLLKPIVRLTKTKNEQLIRGASTINIANKVERFLKTYEVFSNQEIKNLINVDEIDSKSAVASVLSEFENSNYSNVEQMMAVDTRMNLSDDLLNYTDKITMHFSIECRVPMLDLELVEFIESLPENYKLNFNKGKIIHKALAQKVLPSDIVNRPKKGFQSPTKVWFKNEMTTIKKMLLNDKSVFSQYFNIINVEKLLDDHVKGYNKEKQIFLLLSLFFWFKQNKL